MKHIGILAHSVEGSSLCYLAAAHEASKRVGEHRHPDITMSVIEMGRAMPHWDSDDYQPIREIFMQQAARLKAAGADFFVLPDNTAHLALELGGPEFPLPALHIAEVVAADAAQRGFRTIGLLGTKYTMEGSVYVGALKRRDLKRVIPEEADRGFINASIFDELCNGVFSDETRARYVAVIDKLKAEGCDAVVLGCTEIPLLISEADSPLPILDSTRGLAIAAVDVALGARAMPTWTGGPVA